MGVKESFIGRDRAIDALGLDVGVAMLAGSVVFPLGVVLQTTRAVLFASTLAIAGSGLVILAMTATAVGFIRQSA